MPTCLRRPDSCGSLGSGARPTLGGADRVSGAGGGAETVAASRTIPERGRRHRGSWLVPEPVLFVVAGRGWEARPRERPQGPRAAQSVRVPRSGAALSTPGEPAQEGQARHH